MCAREFSTSSYFSKWIFRDFIFQILFSSSYLTKKETDDALSVSGGCCTESLNLEYVLSKFKKLANLGIACLFDIPHYSQFFRFAYFLPFGINEFRHFVFLIFIFYYSDSRKIGHSIFERSLIFTFKMLAILKFDCSKFLPSPSKCMAHVM